MTSALVYPQNLTVTKFGELETGPYYNIFVQGNYAYCTGTGLDIIDISSLLSPVKIGHCDLTDAYGIFVSGSYAHVADGSSGLHIINVSNPASPTLAGSYDTPGEACTLCVRENYVYLADGNSGKFLILKVSSFPEDDFLGTWDGSGVWYRNTKTGAWVSMTTPVKLIASGDIDGDYTADLIGVWSNEVWVKNSAYGNWTILSPLLPTVIAAGDVSGDGRVDLVGNWSSGVWYRDSATISWVMMSSSPATLVATGDMDKDSTDDLIGVFGNGVWVKKSSTGAWVKLSGSIPRDIDAGLYRTLDTTGVVGFVEIPSPGPII